VAALYPLLVFAGEPPAAAPAHLEFNRDIRPILSENCFYCHGLDPKHREAKLRLDLPEEATRDLGGYSAVVPGKPEESEVTARINSDDRDEQMPPPKSNRKLTPAQKETIREWIAQGAEYQKHWAFAPPRRAPLPDVQQRGWPRNPADRFVLARLETEHLAPSSEAKPETWLRRASLDLIGLPPTLEELDAFTADVAARGEAAYESATDRLLASEHFGERQAIGWLDAARYADTHGFNNDSARTMWRWRDWVIDAFNSNKPYNQFIIEQLAGDLLPNATLEQRIATGFGRNHVINSEGGIIDEEYRVEYVADRVRTMSMAWLGLTVECARCHDHKFDPITQRDYYRFFAFFNSVPEYGEDGRIANAAPIMAAPTREQSETLSKQEQELATLEAALRADRPVWQGTDEEITHIVDAAAAARAANPQKELLLHLDCDTAEPRAKVWSFPGQKPRIATGVTGKSWTSAGASPLAKIEPNQIKFDHAGGVTVSLWLRPATDNPRDVALLSSQDYSGVPAGAGYGKGQEVRLVDGEIEVRINERFPAYSIQVVSEGARVRAGEWHHLSVVYSGGKKAANIRIFLDGAELPTRIMADDANGEGGSPSFLVGSDAGKNAPTYRGEIDEIRAFSPALSATQVRAVFLADALPSALTAFWNGAATGREESLLSEMIGRETDLHWRELAERRATLLEQHLALRRNLPSTMVMADLPQPRPTFILKRGQYDAHGETVEPGTPDLLAPWPAGAPRNRLGLALWLTQPNHPLTGRVVVNRVWAQLFGAGFVKTLGDFGSQGEWPSHPELLDWLAREFVDGGWNVKALYRMLVLSATYRQSSAVSAELVARDPENRLLARGPRLRLPAELIRDQALAMSGLLHEHLGGPGVFPYQPEGLYNGVVVGADYPGTKWVQSKGEDLYRRSLYTFWKRTVPYPAMTAFDVPDREVCTVRRASTNTPLQALVLLNDPTYLEAAHQLAARMLREGGMTDDARVAFAFRLATGRRPSAAEIHILSGALQHFRDDFSHDAEGAAKLLKTGSSSVDPALPAGELAAADAVASMILNLDETITKD